MYKSIPLQYFVKQNKQGSEFQAIKEANVMMGVKKATQVTCGNGRNVDMKISNRNFCKLQILLRLE